MKQEYHLNICKIHPVPTRQWISLNITKTVKVGLNSTLRDTSSNLVAKPQLFLSVFQGVHGTRAPVPQGLHLGGLLLERLAGLHQRLQLVLGGDTTDVGSLKYVTYALQMIYMNSIR